MPRLNALRKTLRFIYRHPLNAQNRLGALGRFVKWQIGTRLNPRPVVYQFTERSKLLLERGVTGATGNLYCGLMEYRDMGFLLHFLRPEDRFLDVGANVGVYTVLAAGEIGAGTVCVEPVPNTYERLQKNMRLNELDDRVSALQIGLGSEPGTLRMTVGLDTQNHIATEAEVREGKAVEVPVRTLDTVVSDRCPVLIKIDVEGFETEVLRGGPKTLADPTLRGIIIELNGAGNRYGYDEAAIHQNLLDGGFRPFSYDPIARTLEPLDTYGTHNTIYLRDLPFVRERLRTARVVTIGKQRFTL